MNKLIEKLVQAYTVLYYYYLIDNNKGKSLEEIPKDFKDEVELKANERYVNEYQVKVGENNGL